MEYTMKLVYQSNFWYNDGLKKANIRDLSGAIASLRRSLQYNRTNIAARNLLGLVYYGRGDVVEALVEWILSKNFQSEDNIANYYIAKIQEVPGELETINQAVKRFNQSLEFAQQNGEDLAIIQLKKVVAAHPSFVKAYQLLALLYIKTEQYSEARKVLRTAHKLDTTDEATLRYMYEITQIRKSRPVRARDVGSVGDSEQTVTYNIGNESIIQPTTANYKEHTNLHTVINVLTGLAVGIAVMWFLVLPAITSSRQKENNVQTANFSDQIATQEAQISALKTELDSFRKTDEKAEDNGFTGEEAQNAYEIVMEINKHYKAQDMSDQAMVDELLKINQNALGTHGKDMFNTITEKMYPRYAKKVYATANENLDAGNSAEAISSLETVTSMIPSYDDGKAMLKLAQTYQANNDREKATAQYQYIVNNLKDTGAAAEAQQALDALNTGQATQ